MEAEASQWVLRLHPRKARVMGHGFGLAGIGRETAKGLDRKRDIEWKVQVKLRASVLGTMEPERGLDRRLGIETRAQVILLVNAADIGLVEWVMEPGTDRRLAVVEVQERLLWHNTGAAQEAQGTHREAGIGMVVVVVVVAVAVAEERENARECMSLVVLEVLAILLEGGTDSWQAVLAKRRVYARFVALEVLGRLLGQRVVFWKVVGERLRVGWKGLLLPVQADFRGFR